MWWWWFSARRQAHCLLCHLGMRWVRWFLLLFSQTIMGEQLVQGHYTVAWGRFEPATFRLQDTEHTPTPPCPFFWCTCDIMLHNVTLFPSGESLTYRQIEVVVIARRFQAKERRQWRSHHWVSEVVTSAIEGPVLVMEAHVFTPCHTAVLSTTRQTGYQSQLGRRQQFLIG